MKSKQTIYYFTIVLSLGFYFCNNSTAQIFNYPPTPKQPVKDTIFGKIVTDDYRWLEDMNNQEVKDWLNAQAHYTNSLLDKIPARDQLIEEYKNLDRISKSDIPYGPRKGGNRFFYMKTFASQNTPKLYYKNGNSGSEILLFDPQTYSKGKFKDVAYRFFPSKDGKQVALTLTWKGNEDIATLKIIDVDSKNFLSDSLYPVNSVQAWTPDSKGIIYGALQTSDPLSIGLFQDIEVKYHQIGRNAQEDKTIISRKNNPDLDVKAAELLFVTYSPDQKYLMATAWNGAQDQNRSFFAPAVQFENSNINWKPLAKPEDQIRDAIIYQDKVYVLTRKDAPNFKIVVSSINQFDVKNAQTLIQESNKPIEWWKISKDFLFIQKTDGINTSIDQYNFINGKTDNINLPYRGAAWIETFDAITNDCQIDINSWHSPRGRFNYNPLTHKFSKSEFYVPINYPGTNELMVEELEVKSDDGVMVPLSLIYRKNLKKDGGNIVFMTGYGSYGSSMSPYFNTLYLPLLNRGVIIAVTHTRGGGEKGYNWHMGGFKSTKPNTWKDFIACGEYLTQNKYTSAKHLIGDGTSAGGILIGRAITERPELFAAAINNVPVSNPLRGENRPNGILDAKEFGTVKDSVEALGLIEMDAFLHVKNDVKYPAVLAVAGINDTRVPVWQPAKFVAALQNTNSDRPMLLQVNYDSGHWSEEKLVYFKDYANQFSFALWQAGHKDFQLVKDKP